MNRVFTASRGRIALRVEAIDLGRDLLVVLTGGDSPHLGAVSAAGEGCMDFELPEHRDGTVASKVSRRLSASLGVNVAVVCGIHVDNITAAEITDVLELCDSLTERLLHELQVASEN